MPVHAFAVWTRRVCLAFLLALLLLFDTPFSLRTLLVPIALACGAITIGRVVSGRGHRLWWGYIAYLAVFAASAFASGLAVSGAALVDEVCFALLVWSVADEAELATAAPWAIGLLIGLALLVPQLAGPRSVLDYGRAYHYRSVQQWSGYPELGALCLLGAVGAWAFFSRETRRAVQAAWLVLTMAFVGGIFVMLSRAALVVAAVVGVWVAALAGIRWRQRLPLLLVSAGIVVAAGVALRSPEIVNRILTASAIPQNPDRPLGMRQEYWTRTLEMIRAHPWLGVGPGQFAHAYARTGVTEVPPHAHSLPLHVAAESGLPAMLLFLILWARVIARSLRTGLRSPDTVAWLAVHAMLVSFLLRSLADHFLAGLDTSLRMLGVVAFLFGLAEARAFARGRAEEHSFIENMNSPSRH